MARGQPHHRDRARQDHSEAVRRAPRELDTAQVVAGVHHGLHGPVRALNLAHRAPQHALAASPVAGERVEEPDGALDAAARAKPRREQADQHEREGEGPVRRGQDRERGGDHSGGRYRVRGRENRDPRAGTGARRARGRLCVGTKWARANSPPVRFRDESCAELELNCAPRVAVANWSEESQNIQRDRPNTRAPQPSAPNFVSERSPPWVVASPCVNPLPMSPRTSFPTPWYVSPPPRLPTFGPDRRHASPK